MNKYSGETEINIGGTKLALVYDWRAISKIHSKHGGEVMKNLLTVDPLVIAEIISAGLEKLNPMSAADILEASPPIVQTIKAVEAALLAAYFGVDGVPEAQEQAQEDDSVKKKTE